MHAKANITTCLSATFQSIMQFYHRWLFCLYCLLLTCSTCVCANALDHVPKALVTVPSYRYFANRIAGDRLQVDLMVPVGASAHTFEPTAKQIMAASRADLWFTTGEPFEACVWRALRAYHPSMCQVDLRTGVKLIAGEGGHTHCSCHPDGVDLHMWLSPRVAAQQVQTMVKALQERYPAHAPYFAANGAALHAELLALDAEIRQRLGSSASSAQRLIVVSHPAFAYFGRDYGIKQLSIEVEGKDPTPRQLTQLLVDARKAGTKAIYVQPQYPNKGAALIAQQLGAQLIEVDPYAEDYFKMMRQLTAYFSEAPLVR
jgi:zinc transport system substrate-binding protein